MSTAQERELTTLEYTILGLLGTEPQSGYSLRGGVQTALNRWQTSPAPTYAALKRLERQGLICGEIEFVSATRLRKVYRLTAAGDLVLDEWLHSAVRKADLSQGGNIALNKFLFAEKRMSRERVLVWLDEYEALLDNVLQTRHQIAETQAALSSPHQQLFWEATLIELEGQRTWIRHARERLETNERVNVCVQA